MKKGLLIGLFVLLTITLSACTKDISFILIGDETVYYTTGTPYGEQGFLAHDDKTDISSNVVMEGNVNQSVSGDYKVSYVLDYKGKTYTLERNVYYREEGCNPVADTNITQCVKYWSEYLHTVVKLTFYYEDDLFHDLAFHIFDNVENILEKYHKLSSKYDLFDGVMNITAINNDPGTTHELDTELFDLIQFALDHQDEVDNLFNIALGPVLKIWHDHREDCTSGGACTIPLLADLQAADQFTNPDDITLDSVNHTITMKDHMSIDLGGVSKGYISGKIIDYLDGLGLSGYLLNNGTSNISIGGTHPTRENQQFLLAITDPSFQTEYYATVYLGDGDQLVTSGDYQQYFMVGDDFYHHIINPNTLMPERYSRSVSIITSDPALADLYSTAIFTMSIEDGLAFVNGIDGLEGIWYTLDNEVVMSDHFASQYLGDLFVDERSN